MSIFSKMKYQGSYKIQTTQYNIYIVDHTIKTNCNMRSIFDIHK